MDRRLIDRWTDTPGFRAMLLLAGLAVTPVLAMGVLTTVFGGVVILIEQPAVDLEQAVFALLSIGGALGFIGYARAHLGTKHPDRHNLTATLLCLGAGAMTALGVAGTVAASAIVVGLAPWNAGAWPALLAFFSVANAVWTFAAIGWMQRLTRRYAESTGRVFDGLPVVLLFVALLLVIGAVLATAAL